MDLLSAWCPVEIDTAESEAAESCSPPKLRTVEILNYLEHLLTNK